MNINPLKDEPGQFYAFYTWGRELTRVRLQGPWPATPQLICAVEAQFVLIEHHIGSFDRPL